jgi:hypothetical protein
MAMQCPHPVQPNIGLSLLTTLLSIKTKLKSLQTDTQSPQPLHISEWITISAAFFVLEVGMAILFNFIFEWINPNPKFS